MIGKKGATVYGNETCIYVCERERNLQVMVGKRKGTVCKIMTGVCV